MSIWYAYLSELVESVLWNFSFNKESIFHCGLFILVETVAWTCLWYWGSPCMLSLLLIQFISTICNSNYKICMECIEFDLKHRGVVYSFKLLPMFRWDYRLHLHGRCIMFPFSFTGDYTVSCEHLSKHGIWSVDVISRQWRCQFGLLCSEAVLSFGL